MFHPDEVYVTEKSILLAVHRRRARPDNVAEENLDDGILTATVIISPLIFNSPICGFPSLVREL